MSASIRSLITSTRSMEAFMNGLSHTEATEMLGLTEGQVTARVVAAKRAMRPLAERFVPPSQRRA